MKDYQPKYYYFECVFLIEKLILTGLLIFVDQGSIAQAYVATLTAFTFTVIQTKYMPYAAQKDNLLKQLCEVQLLMTLLISIILRTDLVDEPLSSLGYDFILLGVNVMMVPGFMALAGAVGLWGLAWLIFDYLRKRKAIKLKTAAIAELSSGKDQSEYSQLAKDLQVRVVDQKRAAENQRMRDMIRKAEMEEKKREETARKAQEELEAEELSRSLQALSATSEQTGNTISLVDAAMVTMQNQHKNMSQRALISMQRLEMAMLGGGPLAAQIESLKLKLMRNTKKHAAHIERIRQEQESKDHANVKAMLELKQTLQSAIDRRNAASKAHMAAVKQAESLRERVADLEEVEIAALQKQIGIDREQSKIDLQQQLLTNQIKLDEKNVTIEKRDTEIADLTAELKKLNAKYDQDVGTSKGLLTRASAVDGTRLVMSKSMRCLTTH